MSVTTAQKAVNDASGNVIQAMHDGGDLDTLYTVIGELESAYLVLCGALMAHYRDAELSSDSLPIFITTADQDRIMQNLDDAYRTIERTADFVDMLKNREIGVGS